RDTTAVSAADARLLVRVLRQARPDIDVIELQRQNPSYEGTRNPFADLATVRSPNVSLAVDLSGGFEAVLERSGARSKKKKYRRQLRKFERAGGYRLLQARTPDEVERLLSEFFVMKAARFQANGISDIFGSDEVQKFFTLLFTT